MSSILERLQKGSAGKYLDFPPASILPDVIAPINALTGQEATHASVLAVVTDENGKKRVGFVPLSSLTG